MDTRRTDTERTWRTNYSMVFSPDGVWLASASVDGTVQIWNLETGYCQQTLHIYRDSVYSVAFLLNSSTLIIPGMGDNSIQVWDTVTNQMLQTLKGHSDTIRAIDFSPSNNDLLASRSWGHTVRIWDLATSSCLQTLQSHDGHVCTIAFSPDGIRLASGSSDRTIKVGPSQRLLPAHALPARRRLSSYHLYTRWNQACISAKQ